MKIFCYVRRYRRVIGGRHAQSVLEAIASVGSIAPTPPRGKTSRTLLGLHSANSTLRLIANAASLVSPSAPQREVLIPCRKPLRALADVTLHGARSRASDLLICHIYSPPVVLGPAASSELLDLRLIPLHGDSASVGLDTMHFENFPAKVVFSISASATAPQKDTPKRRRQRCGSRRGTAKLIEQERRQHHPLEVGREYMSEDRCLHHESHDLADYCVARRRRRRQRCCVSNCINGRGASRLCGSSVGRLREILGDGASLRP